MFIDPCTKYKLVNVISSVIFFDIEASFADSSTCYSEIITSTLAQTPLKFQPQNFKITFLKICLTSINRKVLER
jgi:hypothetical protein